jgi:hypothetical protein
MFIRKLPVALTAAVAVLVINAVATSPASATTFELTNTRCEGEVNWDWCYEGENKLKEKGAWELTSIEGTGQSTTSAGGLLLILAGVPEIHIECGGGVYGGPFVIDQIEPLGSGGARIAKFLKGFIKYTGCALNSEGTAKAIFEKCTIPAEKETNELTGELLSESEILLSPVSNVLIGIKFSGATCPAGIAGEHDVTGKQQLTVQKPGTAEMTKEVVAVHESKLEFFESPAKLEESLTISFTGLGVLILIKLG